MPKSVPSITGWAGDKMKKILIAFLFSLIVLSLSAMGERASSAPPAQERDGSEKKPHSLGIVNDETTAIEIASKYFKENIDAKGPKALNLGEPQAFNDTKHGQWIVSWSVGEGEGAGRISIVVNTKTGQCYQADTGSD
jgi:hypothetical protein